MLISCWNGAIPAYENRHYPEPKSPQPLEDEALGAADAEWKRLRRGEKTLELNLAQGRGGIIPQAPVIISFDIKRFNYIVGGFVRYLTIHRLIHRAI